VYRNSRRVGHARPMPPRHSGLGFGGPGMTEPRLSAGSCDHCVVGASATAIAALLAAAMLAALAGILGLLTRLLSAALLLLAGLLLPTLLLLAIVSLALTRVLVLLRILAHGRSPVAQPLTGEDHRLKLANTRNVPIEMSMPRYQLSGRSRHC
jgi:hypothetical protein